MVQDRVAEFIKSLAGRRCDVTRRSNDWAFAFSEDLSLAVSAPWRVVRDGRISVASADDGQMFGLTSPVDVEVEARRILAGKTVREVTLNEGTGDLALHFDRGTRIDVFNNSTGYEGWHANYAVGEKRWSLIAMGGGEIASFAD